MNPQTVSQAWSLIGHNWAVDLLRRSVAARRLPHALLITGSPNVGKGTLALSLARELLCTAEQKPCNICRACHLVAAKTHPDLLWTEPQSGSLKIAQIRELTRQLSLAPLEGPWQIAAIDHFELATPGAANALLKTLEEPPPNVILMLLAQEAEALLPTIVSRCQIIALRPIPRPLIEQALIEQWQVEPANAQMLSHICGGRIGWAISTLTAPELLEQRSQRLDELVALLHGQRVARFAYANALARQAIESILETLELWTAWWRDLLLLTSTSSVPITNIDRRAEMIQFSTRCDVNLVQNTLSVLRTTISQLSQNANSRLALEVLLLNIPFFSQALPATQQTRQPQLAAYHTRQNPRQ